MAKNKNKPQIINNIQKLNLEIDYDKLAVAIAKSKQLEVVLEEKKKEDERIEWRKSLGFKSYDDKKGLGKILLIIANRIKMFLNFMFFSSKKKVLISPTSIILKNVTTVFFHFIKLTLWFLSAMFLIVMFYHPGIEFVFFHYITCIWFSIFSFILAGIFRIIAIEIEQMSDRERVLGIFTAVISIIPLIKEINDMGWFSA